MEKNDFIIEIKVYERVLAKEIPILLHPDLFEHSNEGPVIPLGYHTFHLNDTRERAEASYEILSEIDGIKTIGFLQVSS
jgi:hypothetical protein